MVEPAHNSSVVRGREGLRRQNQPGSHCKTSHKNTSRVGVEGKGIDKLQHPKKASPAVDFALTLLTEKV